MLTYLMLVRLAHLAPTFVLQRIDRLIEPLRTTCSTKVKANSVKQGEDYCRGAAVPPTASMPFMF